MHLTESSYHNLRDMRSTMKEKGQYRPNIAIIILNDQNKILAGKRHAHHQTWQLPQGGIEPGETPLEALKRELEEETGLVDFTFVAQSKKWIYYKWPPEVSVQDRAFIGQKQRFFVINVGNVPLHKLHKTEEFVEFAWFSASEILSNVVHFKRSSYEQAFTELADYIGYRV